ncbi:RAB7A-interacting MON1-CCZ1 complex subunit 1-like isoform X6 [Mytilus californianus]|uniref:RAB7A-interacting MON1-CCZ1 complex subunit 1-like isoform X6 n=1 Tax=Mytilus californianus TaxID=6549 RepID=UPI002247E0B4|nr:RAB7A-interacting MON1-CCZ1 complex subunit 1-like isoform X6 [Mytilus californianus]
MTAHITERLNQIHKLCDKALISNDDKVLKQLKDKCCCYIDVCKKSPSEESLVELLKQYAQIVLDYTYIDETKLVDELFPQDTCKERIHTIFVWIDTIEELVKKCLPETSNVKQGIEYLQQMLSGRFNTSEWEGDQDAVNLASMGIYSDTHLLSMMYAGEMCYWFCNKPEQSTSDFNPKVIGQDLLSKYIACAKSPVMYGWSTDKAEEFLKVMST